MTTKTQSKAGAAPAVEAHNGASGARGARGAVLELKGGVFNLTVLRLLDAELAAIERALAEKIQKAPGLFQNAPLVIDLGALPGARIEFAALVRAARSLGLIAVAVQNANAAQRAAAVEAGLGVFAEPARSRKNGRGSSREGNDPAAKAEAADSSALATPALNEAESGHARSSRTTAGRPDIGQTEGELVPEASPAAQAPAPSLSNPSSAKVITQPVRSGQQIYARGGDLLVLSAVNAGSEILADGHIHVYGPLRGRALAGVRGNEKALIFCMNLEAELLSIAGNYRVFEEIDTELRGRPAQIYLEGGRLKLRPI